MRGRRSDPKGLLRRETLHHLRAVAGQHSFLLTLRTADVFPTDNLPFRV